MILVLLGTQDKPFERILKAVSSEIKKGNIKEKVIAQVGCTKFNDNRIESFDFIAKDEIYNFCEFDDWKEVKTTNLLIILVIIFSILGLVIVVTLIIVIVVF